MSIWFRDYTLDDLKVTDVYMAKHLGIELVELGPEYLRARMPVDERTKMPLGLLHGGASCVLIESLGTYASYLCIDPEKQKAVGLDINATHLRGVKDGYVIGTVTPVHLGRRVHVWGVEVRDRDEGLVSTGRLILSLSAVS